MPEGALSRRAATQCDQCGQVDDHPKVHVGDPGDSDGVATKHHDCLSVREKDLLVGSAQQPGSVKASSVIRECEGGLRGEELLAFILGDRKKADQAVGGLHNDAPAGPAEVTA